MQLIPTYFRYLHNYSVNFLYNNFHGIDLKKFTLEKKNIDDSKKTNYE